MLIDAIGIAAGLAVIATFYSVVPVKVRLLAILSNLLFIGYAIAAGLWPVLILHTVLLPLNLWRLDEVRSEPKPRLRTPFGYAAPRPLRRRAGLPFATLGDVQPSLCRA